MMIKNEINESVRVFGSGAASFTKVPHLTRQAGQIKQILTRSWPCRTTDMHPRIAEAEGITIQAILK